MSQHTKERTEELGGFAEYEVRNAYPCGCVAVVCQCGCGNPPEIIECSLHAHAQAMREQLARLSELISVLRAGHRNGGIFGELSTADDDTLALLAALKKEPEPMERDEDEAGDLGHRKIHCKRCGYRGWSEDTGWCPVCPLDPDTTDEEKET